MSWQLNAAPVGCAPTTTGRHQLQQPSVLASCSSRAPAAALARGGGIAQPCRHDAAPQLQRRAQWRPAAAHPRCVVARAVGTDAGGMAPQLKAAIDSLIQSNKVVVFIKGTKEFPQCGFSNTVVQILRSVGAPFESVNILENEALRSGMKEYSQWPTFPQVYVDGEFYGGCDIMIEAFQNGELQETLERVLNE